MINVDEVRAQVADILNRFPSAQGTAYRQTFDKYGQPDGQPQELGTVTFWWKQPEMPKSVETDRSGTRFQEDDPKWACILWRADLPDVKRGDLFQTGGQTYRIGNRTNRMNVRVFWQLFEVTA